MPPKIDIDFNIDTLFCALSLLCIELYDMIRHLLGGLVRSDSGGTLV
jgi:hypothetical protein